jgi:hypothetical protein
MPKHICLATLAKREYYVSSEHRNDQSDHEHDWTGDECGHNVLKDD